MSSRQEFLDQVIRRPVRLAMHPNIRDVSVDAEGYFFDVLANTRLGDPLQLDQDHVQNKIALVNFFTIRSEASDQKMASIARLVAHLGDRVGRDFFINSVTSDPEHDTPKRLAAFARELGAPDGWAFVRATATAYRHMGSRMNRVRGYSSGREVFYGTPGGFWGTFPFDNAPEATARRLVDSLPGPKPAQPRRAGPARRGKEKYPWSAREI